MEDSDAGAARTDAKPANHTSLTLAMVLSFASFSFAFVQTWILSFGVETLPRIATVFKHPHVLSELVAESLGASLFFPIAHVAIASLFPSMRNPSSRRRIFIGWSIFIMALGAWSLWNSKVF